MQNNMKRFSGKLLFLLLIIPVSLFAENGSQLWLRYQSLPDSLPRYYSQYFQTVTFSARTPTRKIALQELKDACLGLCNQELKQTKKIGKNSIVIGTSDDPYIANLINSGQLKTCGSEGFMIKVNESEEGTTTAIAANSDIGLLYGTFELIRQMQIGKPVSDFNKLEAPSYQRRLLNHWDNLDGTVERGYAGHSIWKWNELPGKISPRYAQYGRANASIGINGTVLNNVNANPDILKYEYLKKVQAIADVLRPFGIRVYLSVNFSSPKVLDSLSTADPLDTDVRNWWQKKADEIYQLIPDFGGFLVKANSEGLPGPQDFGRTHADGANMLADALAPHGGIVMWRAFVYSPNGNDRTKQAYDEFMPLDGKFHRNVIIQVKNGPLDFQPREPFSPLFGSMKHTTLMPELQITKEYLGFSDHLAYLGTLYKEFLDADTYTHGKNSTVASITDGTIFHDSITAIAGVANIGEDTNWCGSNFAQSNWYVFGRLAWNNQLTAKEISLEWLKQTFSHDPHFLNDISKVMMQSREAVVDYMTPIGLAHLMGWGHHYGPEPWCKVPGARADWLPSYYHRADSIGIGFDRTTAGSNAVSQYAEPLRSMFDDPQLCPEAFLLWFHHVPWDYTLRNGNDLWTELCYKYSSGVDAVRRFQKVWDDNQEFVDPERFEAVKQKLVIQSREAVWWRDACLLYFQTFSHRPIPRELDRPVHQLDQLKKLKFDLKSHN